MSFTCMQKAEYVKWKEKNLHAQEMDTNLWITDMVDAVRDGTEDE